MHRQRPPLLVAAGCLNGFAARYIFLRGKFGLRLPWLAGILASLTLVLGWQLAEQAAAHEEEQIQVVTESFARLYAREMKVLGHAGLSDDAAADDPLYLALINTQRHWLAINPAVHDIYTLRKRADGTNAFLVDSETDYNRNGHIDEERERRTPIGEVYDPKDTGIETAFRGHAAFDYAPVTDRWGTWVSAYAPVLDADGKVEAVLGVDFSAAEFAQRIAAARHRVLYVVALVECVILAASLFIGLMHARAEERHRSVAALRESEERFVNAFQHAPIGIALVAPDGRCLKVNRALCELIGYCSAEMATMSCGDFTHPDDHGTDAEDIRRMLAGELETCRFEKRLLHKHGHEVLTSLNVSLVRDSGGQPLHFITQIQDITQRRQAEVELRANERRFRELVQNLPAAIFTCDVRGRVKLYNRAAVELWGREPVLGKDRWSGAWRIYETDGTPLSLDECPMAETLRTGIAVRGREIIVERPDGTRSHVLPHPTAICDEAGKVVGAMNMLADLTYRREIEAKIAKVNGELIETSRRAGMADVATRVLHTVGNVLNSVNVSATLALDAVRTSKSTSLGKVAALLENHSADLANFVAKDPQGTRVPEYLRQLNARLEQERQTIGRELAVLTSNLRHIKEIVGIQQSYGRVTGGPELLRASDLVENSLRLADAALTNSRCEIIRDFENVDAISIEKHKVLQILVNLIGNAIYACADAGHGGGRITLRVRQVEKTVEISVADDGVGIPRENLPRVFHLGFTTRKDGHGFGLHSAALCATELGGSLRCASAGPGCGATFTLALPTEFPA